MGLYFAFWAFWMILIHYPAGAKIRDTKLLEIGLQTHFAGEVCAGAILNVMCFGLRNVWFVFRHPRWFVVLSTPLETIKLGGSTRDSPRGSVSSMRDERQYNADKSQ